MAATTPTMEDLWPKELELIPKVEFRPPDLSTSDFLPDLEERRRHESEFALKMVLQETWWMEPY